MSYEQISVLIILFVFVSYVGIVWKKFGVQPSISDSFYCWKGGWGHLFTLFCWAMALPIMIAEPVHFFFITMCALGFVGTAAEINRESVAKVHNPSAVVAIVSALAGISVVFGHWYIALVAVIIASIIGLLKVPNKIWWIEIVAFIAVISSFIVEKFNLF